jgi:hypothetical protein
MNTLKNAAIRLILIALATGCSSTQPMIADKSVQLTSGMQISYATLAAAAIAGVVVWYIADPLAPTWSIARRKLADDRYRIDLRQKRLAVGGDGEAQQVFHRAAEALAEENGFSGYTVVSYTEGIESGPVLGQRVSRGIVLLTSAYNASVSR